MKTIKCHRKELVYDEQPHLRKMPTNLTDVCQIGTSLTLKVPLETSLTPCITLDIVIPIPISIFVRNQAVQPGCKSMHIPYLPRQLAMFLLHLGIKFVVSSERIFLLLVSFTTTYHDSVYKNIGCPCIGDILLRLLLDGW
jgi:hypothetical protein